MIFLVIVPCILCFVYAWRRRQKYLEGKLPPVADGAWPIIGHFHLWIRGRFWNRLLGIQKDCLAKGGITYLYSGTNPSYTFYGLSDPKDCSIVANDCHQRGFLLEDFMKDVFGDGLLTVSVWENHRQVLSPVFKQMFSSEDVNRHAKELVKRLTDKLGKGLFDPTECLRETTLKILFATVFGINKEGHFTSRKDCIKAYQTGMQEISRVLFERYQSFLLHKPLFYNCSRLKRRQNECARVIKNVSNEIVTGRKKDFSNTDDRTAHSRENSPTCLLDVLLKLEAQGVYSEQQIIDEVNTVMYSGYDTLVKALNFVLVMLGSHLDVQEKVYLEIKDLHNDTKYEVEEFSKLKYLQAVIMETLRLYPPVSTVSRLITSTKEIKNYSIDPEMKCLFFIYAMNRHPCWGQDSETFRPERWLTGSLPEHRGATFGMGMRSCPGKNLSLNIIKVILIHLLKEYKVISDYTKMTVTQRMLLTPVSGHHICLEERRNSHSPGQIPAVTTSFRDQPTGQDLV